MMSKVKDPLDPISRPSASEGAPPESPSAAEATHSPLLILFGLLVVWGSLYLVAVAQSISYAPPAGSNTVLPTGGGTSALMRQSSFPDSLPVSSMLMPVENLSLKEIPARQVVKDLLYKAHLHIAPQELDKIAAEARDVHFENKPLYECLYSSLGEDGLGFMVVDDMVVLIPQQLTHQVPDQGPLEQFHWEADLLLGDQAASLFPSGRSDLWVRLRLLPPSATEGEAFRIAFEIFRGSGRESFGEAILPAPGAGSLRFVTGSTLSLRIENRSEVGASAEEGTREFPVGVSLKFQSHEFLAGDETGDDDSADDETSATLETAES